ncbi:MAG: heavy-metal-associated domain-containing protein [Candidatus Roizmanbacteria bacterium]
MKKITLKVNGMHCASCALSIDFDLEDLEGVQKVKTNYAPGTCDVEYDDEKISVETILKQIEGVGYEALQVKTVS